MNARTIRLALVIFAATFSLAAGPARVTVTPVEDASAVLHNPDMGWVLYENYPVDPHNGGLSTMVSLQGENFDGVDAVAVMFAWSDVETRPGQYDFSSVDRAYDYWKSRGKEMQLRMSTETLLWWNKSSPPRGVGVPQYVLDRLPAAAKQVRRDSGIDYNVVDAREPYYLDRLAKFLSAVASHFDRERPVTLIDLRGFGEWGEWHSGFRYPTLEARQAALRGILDCWSNAFPKHAIALSYSHDPDGSPDYYNGPTHQFDPAFTKHYQDYLRYSTFDYAMTKPNITLRRDGVGGAVSSNERKFCDEAFNTLAKGPFACEFVQTYIQAKQGDKNWMPFLIRDALSLHPNYINLLGYQCADALNFMKDQSELFADGLRNMGYRLVPTSISFPQTIRAGEAFDVETTWVNRGVGRAQRDCHLRLILGSEISDAGALPTSKWIKGKSYSATCHASFESVLPGKYPLRVELYDPAAKRLIAMPLKSNEIATIEVTN